MSDKLIGKSLAGRFVLGEQLGTGATGSVYKAMQTAVDRTVAIKTLHPFLQEREDFQARFEIEAKAIARLNHPNCITLYDYGYDDEFDVFYMAVEFIDGQLLADMMSKSIPYEEVLSITYQVAEALEHAHREGILHRDLKPENIMIQRSANSGRPMVKVLDFGLARLYETKLVGGEETPTGRYQHITQAGQVYGTPAYMSPEQCRAREELTPATDLYALGTMMFELLEGHLPFFSQSTAELIMMQMTEEPPKMERIDVPAKVRDIIHAMMAKDPEARPQSAKDVLVTLLPHVRLDASQEFRIVPSESGEYRSISQSQLDLKAPRTRADSWDLSNDELKAAQAPKNTLLFIGAAALMLGFVGAMLVLALMSEGEGHAETSANRSGVDGAASVIADSTESDPASGSEEPDGEEPVEVADNADSEPAPAAKKRRKNVKQKAEPSKQEPEKSDQNRPKTLKLTY